MIGPFHLLSRLVLCARLMLLAVVPASAGSVRVRRRCSYAIYRHPTSPDRTNTLVFPMPCKLMNLMMRNERKPNEGRTARA